MKRLSAVIIFTFAFVLCSLPMAARAQQPLSIHTLSDKKVAQLPSGELYWRIENFSTAAQARAAAGPWSLVAEASGKIWLFTLGAKGDASAGGARVAEVGPIERLTASNYLLRINEATGPTGSVTPVHHHPGSEAFWVLSGEQSIRTPHGVMRVTAGQAEAGCGADVPMQVSSSGSTDLRALVMFVVDATKPFSSPDILP